MNAQPALVQHLNPEGLNTNPAFTNVVVVSGSVKTNHIGGQDAVDASGAVAGKGDLGAQTEQVLKNLQIALATARASATMSSTTAPRSS